jgi:DNA-binding NarL/FixJ family response regulator
VAEGEIWADRHTVGRFFREVRARLSESSDLNPGALALLTQREWEIARLIAQGWSNKRLAKQLGVCERTIKTHLNNIFRKRGVTNRTQLALLVLRAQAPWGSSQK